MIIDFGMNWEDFYKDNILSYIKSLQENPFELVTLILDIAIVIFLIYCFLKVVKGSRAWQLIKGIALLIVVTWISGLLNLKILNWILTGIMNLGVIAIIVIFQPELRRGLEQLGTNKLTKFFGIDKDLATKTKEDIYKVVIAATEMCIRDRLTGDNGILMQASDSKIETAVGTVKEQLKLLQGEKIIQGEKVTPEILLAEGKVRRTVQLGENDKYYMCYALKENSIEGMQGLGKGILTNLKDVFLIDDELNVKYIASNGKEFGDEIKEKILEDETEIKFVSKAFSEYISKISCLLYTSRCV